MMRELIKKFPEQLKESISIAKEYNFKSDRNIKNILICGLGGSGIGGEIIKQWAKKECKYPVEVCHNYDIPNYIDENSLVIACSYSGNTEETLSALEEAIEKNALIIGVTSGGKLQSILDKNNSQCVIIPGGLPPRSALAYPLVQLANIFDKLELVETSLVNQIETALNLIVNNQSEIEKMAFNSATKTIQSNLLIYGEDQFKPVLLRACQQLNENSKELGFFNVVPEMNHNEIVGWANNPKNIYTIFLRSNLESAPNSKRLDITQGVIKNKSENVEIIMGIGENLVEQSLYFIHLLDWVSLIRAETRNIDVVEVNVIDYLKGELAKN